MATNAQAKEFIAKIAPLIREEAKKRGYVSCAAVIAQACIESAYGTSSLGYKYHNYFGMKAGKSWKGGVVNLRTKEEFKVGTLTTITDGFRTYKSINEGVAGYYDFISTTRYANLKTAPNYIEYAKMLKADGYATSSTYVNTLCSTVQKWNLDAYELDGASAVVTNVTEVTNQTKSKTDPLASVELIKMGSKGPSVLYCQNLLNARGYSVTADGIFGAKTLAAVKKFQLDKGLTSDGIVGMKTWAKLVEGF